MAPISPCSPGAGQADPLEHHLGMAARCVGMDDLAARERPDGVRQGRVGMDLVQIHRRHLIEIAHRIEPVMDHQPAQGEAVAREIALLDAPRLGRVDIEKVGDEGPHMPVDMGDQPLGDRIERVIEVENPGLDVIDTRIR